MNIATLGTTQHDCTRKMKKKQKNAVMRGTPSAIHTQFSLIMIVIVIESEGVFLRQTQHRMHCFYPFSIAIFFLSLVRIYSFLHIRSREWAFFFSLSRGEIIKGKQYALLQRKITQVSYVAKYLCSLFFYAREIFFSCVLFCFWFRTIIQKQWATCKHTAWFRLLWGCGWSCATQYPKW